jgi:CSLREA domain-containing protein
MSRRGGIRVAASMIVAALFLVAAGDARAETFRVTKLADTGGPCEASDCSLRAAIDASNAGPALDLIEFEADVRGTIALGSELPTVSDPVEIHGPGEDELAVSGDQSSRILTIDLASEGGVVEIRGLTLRDGSATDDGGAIANVDAALTLDEVTVDGNVVRDSVDQPRGGGIVSSGPLTITRSTISDNSVRTTGPDASHGPRGGGIFAADEVSIFASTIEGNSAGPVAPGATGGEGGGLYAAGPATVERSTIVGNRAVIGDSGFFADDASYGGGIFAAGELDVTSSTVTDNSSYFGGGILAESGRINNAIVALNSRPELRGEFSFTFSMIGEPPYDESYPYTYTEPLPGTNLFGVDPQLGELGDHGGPTETIPILDTSPAIDCGNSGGQSTDQRGMPRPLDVAGVENALGGDGSDMGAFENQGPSSDAGGCVEREPPPIVDEEPPDTGLTKDAPKRLKKRKTKFRFLATEPNATFECRLDDRPWKGCTSPKTVRKLDRGKHRFKVRATDASGNTDTSPAKDKFKVVRRR